MKTLLSLILLTFTAATITAQNADNAIKVSVTGSGEPILFLAGFATDGDAVWKDTVDKLSKTKECHVVNYAGFAGQDSIEFPWLPKVIESIQDYIENKNLKNLTLIGHSLGGTISMRLATNKEFDIKQLILVDALPATGALMMPNFDPELMKYDSAYNQQMLEMDDGVFASTITGMATNMTTSDAGKSDLIKWMQTTDRKTFVYGYTDYLKLDARPYLSEIKTPVTIIAATMPYGEAAVKSTIKSQFDNLSEYDLVLAADSAHFIMMDQPEWFLLQIVELVSK
ncbi:alpha/beta fold hydrolase [Nonlabens ponticola]|uniref:Alpha/beta hydrolase n=1 Tax=Nonlabens ponticola TaxID=2496866 RepID=A0A3S9MVP3_9FLAO|nr:alpha/beta hydrolase [Nonlabens ponticola]AZQ43199.1 alpha/beta hydrolase [Nonlabens ponticola]